MILIVMGVAGSGKSTIGRLLADRLRWPFYDGDDFHPPANVAKMQSGQPLTDKDRSGWLSALADLIRECVTQNRSAVIACSALKQRYRDQLQVDASVHFVYLRGSYDLIEARMRQRTGHYMPPSLLASQFAALEEPLAALTIDIDQTPEQIVDEIVSRCYSDRSSSPNKRW
jgi:gluconokinase